MSSAGAFTGPPAIVPPQRGAGWVPPNDRLAPFGCAVAADASPRRSRIDRPDLHAPCRRRGAPRGRAERARGCADLAHRITGPGRGGSGQPAVAALFRLSAVHSWVAPRITIPHSPRGSEPGSGPASEANRFAERAGRSGCAYYRVISTRVPSGIPDSRRNAAGGTRTQPLLTAWPNTDGSGQPCRPTVPGPPPKVESALE